MTEHNNLLVPLADRLLRESERYKAACRYVLSADYISKETLIAILDIEETNKKEK